MSTGKKEEAAKMLEMINSVAKSMPPSRKRELEDVWVPLCEGIELSITWNEMTYSLLMQASVNSIMVKKMKRSDY